MLFRSFKYLLILVCSLVVFLPSDFGYCDDIPGTLIAFKAASSKQFVASPCLAILPNGTYVATYSLAVAKDPRIFNIHVHVSKDQGRTWKKQSQIDGQIRSTLFAVDDTLYLMGTPKHFSDWVIRRSDDEGETWSEPSDDKSGRLTKGKRYNALTMPMPVINGRIFRSCEEWIKGRYQPLIFSAEIDSDLMNASSWKKSNLVQFDPTFFGGKADRISNGSVVPTKDANHAVICRVVSQGSRAAIMSVSEDGHNLEFDVDSAFIPFPTRHSRFIVRYDPVSRRYWSISNQIDAPRQINNRLVLVSSEDLRSWDVETILLDHVDCDFHAFNQCFWHVEGDDIVAVCGTAWDGSAGCYRPNYFTFHRFRNFRDLTMEDSAPTLGRMTPNRYETDDVEVKGINFKLSTLGSGRQIFKNRGYKFLDVPQEFSGWQFTQVSGGNRSDLVITAKRDCEVFFMTAMDQERTDVTGWSLVEASSFAYNDRNRTKLYVFKRKLSAGEVVTVPTGTWSGGMVMFQPKD